ncbi:MAG: hypothetical protein ABI688_06995 [Bacteroidota bacterium]
MALLTGAIIGGIIGLIVAILNFSIKEKKFKKIMKTVTVPVDYSGLYHYASFKRYKNSFKFFDSYGALYLAGNTVYYKTSETGEPLTFNLAECSVTQEADWRWLKWFSITTPAGEKYYFDSNKMGGFKNNSDETLKGLAVIKGRTTA